MEVVAHLRLKSVAEGYKSLASSHRPEANQSCERRQAWLTVANRRGRCTLTTFRLY
jgi:hypothetical protein